MASRPAAIIAIGLAVIAAVAGGYFLWRSDAAPPIVGVVRTTEIRVAPEVGGQLADIKVRKGDRVRAGDVVAELSALELTASVAQARAALGAANASRDHVFAGVRAEEIAALAAGIAKSKAKLEYARAQLTRTAALAQSNTATQQALDQAENDAAAARADVAEAQANHDAAVAGPTREERAIADAQVKAAASALAVLERRLDKTICARRPTASSPSSSPRTARTSAPASRCWRSRRPASGGCHSTHGKIGCAGSRWERRSMLRGRARAKQYRPLLPSWCRSGHSRLGRPSVRSGTMIATHCDCGSTREPMRSAWNPA